MWFFIPLVRPKSKLGGLATSHAPEGKWKIYCENAEAYKSRMPLQKRVHPIMRFFNIFFLLFLFKIQEYLYIKKFTPLWVFSQNFFLLLLLFKTILDGQAFLKPRTSSLQTNVLWYAHLLESRCDINSNLLQNFQPIT